MIRPTRSRRIRYMFKRYVSLHSQWAVQVSGGIYVAGSEGLEVCGLQKKIAGIGQGFSGLHVDFSGMSTDSAFFGQGFRVSANVWASKKVADWLCIKEKRMGMVGHLKGLKS